MKKTKKNIKKRAHCAQFVNGDFGQSAEMYQKKGKNCKSAFFSLAKHTEKLYNDDNLVWVKVYPCEHS